MSFVYFKMLPIRLRRFRQYLTRVITFEAEHSADMISLLTGFAIFAEDSFITDDALQRPDI
jgi:hypothetical protein